jgi:hypothetical protein
MNLDYRDQLIEAWLDGTLDDQRFEELETELLESAAARDAFWDRAAFHGLVAEAARLTWNSGSDERPSRRRTTWRPTGWAAAMLGAAAITAAVVLLMLFSTERADVPSHSGVATGTATVTVPLATVTRSRFLRADDAAGSLAVGRPVGAGRVVILDGGIELTLKNGVVITLEGPADLDLASEMEAFLHDGSAVVRMPEGTDGFRLKTATADVLDLGTEFAVKASRGFYTDVQVYEGAVIATGRSSGSDPRFPKRLEAGQSARFSPHGPEEPEPIPYSESRFVRRLPAESGIPIEPLPGLPRDAAHERRQWGQPQCDAILVRPAPATVTIDGRLDEWRDGPGFMSFRDGTPSCPEWSDGRMMYDERHLYIAAHVGDPAPMKSVIDPAVDPIDGWRGGSVQVRLSTDRKMGWPADGHTAHYFVQRQSEPTAAQKVAARNPRLAHLTLWYHAPSRTPCLAIQHGMLVSAPVVNASGVQAAYTRDADGRGYVLEYAIPWGLLNCADDPPRAGDRLATVWQVNWSDADGRMRREHMVEIRNPHEPLQINVWERAATWGRAEYR